MKITIFKDSDLKKCGGFKKKNNISILNKEEFFKYLLENNLSLSKGYIDNIGFISNSKKFKCNFKGFMVGVTSLINEFEGLK